MAFLFDISIDLFTKIYEDVKEYRPFIAFLLYLDTFVYQLLNFLPPFKNFVHKFIHTYPLTTIHQDFFLLNPVL